METRPEAKHYHRIKNRLFIINLFFSFAVLITIILSGFSIWIKTRLAATVPTGTLLNGAYFIVLSVILYCAGFPFDFYEGFILEHRFKLSNQTLSMYLKDNLKKAIIYLIIGLIAIEGLYLFLEKFTQVWWIFAAIGWFCLTVILAKITPSVVIPLFYKYLPLEDEALKAKIKELFIKTQTPLKDVSMINFSSKTKKLNAAVVGFGKSRRVILADTLLCELSHDEIISIVAHELGHYKNKDTVKIIMLSAVVTTVLFSLSDIVLRKSFSFFGYEAIFDIAGFPLFALSMLVLGFLALPLQNGFVRSLEEKADSYSICLTKTPDIFISMMKKLSAKNLADMNPSKFVEIMLYDHPPVGRRIRLAQDLKEKL